MAHPTASLAGAVLEPAACPITRPVRAFDSRVATLPSPCLGGPRALLVGDSTGVGVGAASREAALQGLLAREYRGLTLVNLCRSGTKVADAAAQLAPFVASGARFELVLILVGGNDVLRATPADQLTRHSRALLQAVRRVAAHAVWMGCADIGTAPFFPKPLAWWFSRRSRSAMQALAHEAARASVDFIDFARPEHSRRFAQQAQVYFAPDGVHPSAAAYRYCFEVLKQRLQERRVPMEGWSQPDLPST